jgi:hypothetical protein
LKRFLNERHKIGSEREKENKRKREREGGRE